MDRNDRARHGRFESEMLPHMDVLYGYASYLSGDRDVASDLLQETYLKAYRFFDKFQTGTNARAWLYRIMRNTYINEYRRLKRLPDLVEYDDQLSAYQMPPRDSDASGRFGGDIHGEMFEDDVAEAIAALPEKFKSVVVLRDIQDLPYEEIATALEIPVGTVRSRLHRARSILFGRLKEYARSRGYRVGNRFIPTEFALAS